MTFVDIGAHLGYFSLLAASRIGAHGRIFAFEPAPPSRELLQKTVRENGLADLITVVPCAVSDAPGHVFFQLNDDAMLNRIGDQAEGPDRIQVETESLDHYFASQGFPPVDLIKIDVEGHELGVFRGMTELNRRNPRLKLVFEYGNTADGTAVLTELQRLGFNRFYLLHEAGQVLNLPDQLPLLNQLAAEHYYVNVLAEKQG
jgi:FkbM family methyltransferase